MIMSAIQELREATGAGVMDCKRALEAAGGDLERAKAVIAERGLVKAGKREGRETGAGFLEAYVHAGRVGVLLEVRCETDFVARSNEFRTLTHDLALQIAAMKPEGVAELLAQPFIKQESMKVEDLVKQAVAKLGENIRVIRFARYEI